MMLKIVKRSDGLHTILRVSGRIRSEDIATMREQMDGHTDRIVLDLEEVTLVDLDVVRFLGACEAEGAEVVHCAPYIRNWIFRERDAKADD